MTLDRTETDRPILYTYNLQYDGAWFFLHIENHHVRKDIEAAKRWLRANRDCAGFTVVRD